MKISVVIPLYNKRETVFRALNSVIIQTVQPEEIIVIDDGSTDGSEQLVKELNDELIRIVHQLNAGVSAARNRGIAEAKGDWIAFLDADDEWLPQYLETVVSLSESWPECSVVATSYFLQDIKTQRNVIKLKKMPFTADQGLLTNYFEVASSSHPPLWTSAVVVKKEAILSVGGFPEGIKSGEDLLTWARLAAAFKIAYSLRPLSVFMQDKAHTYIEKPNRVPQIPDRVGEGLVHLARQHSELSGIREYVSHWFKMRTSIFLRLGMKRSSFNEALRSLYYNPFNFRVLIYILLIPLPTGFVKTIFRRMGNA